MTINCSPLPKNNSGFKNVVTIYSAEFPQSVMKAAIILKQPNLHFATLCSYDCQLTVTTWKKDNK